MSDFKDAFGGRMPYPVDNSVEVDGVSYVPTAALDSACKFLSHRVGKCPLECFCGNEVTVICQCDSRHTEGMCTPSDSGPCWRALIEWGSDPFANEHVEAALSEKED